MIIDRLVEVKIINHNKQHYIDIGLDVKYGDVIKINPKLLSSGSHIYINVMCQHCGEIFKRKFQDYYGITKGLKEKYFRQKCVKSNKTKYTLIKKYGVDNISKSEEIKNRKKETNIKNWGVENVFQNEKIKEKSKKTCLEKYGVENINNNYLFKEKSKQTRIKNGNQIPDSELSKYNKYRRDVMIETRKHKKYLFENWNGYDHYDNEYIRDNYSLYSNDKKYPTIDHKISIFYGMLNNIKSEIIGNIDNLFITKRCNNCIKGSKNNLILNG